MRNGVHGLLNIALAVTLVLVLWQLAASAMGDARLPRPAVVGHTAIRTLWSDSLLAGQGAGDRGMAPHIAATAGTWFISMIVGVGSALGIVLFMQQLSDAWSLALDQLLEFARAVPPIVSVPFVLILSPVSAPALVASVYSALSFAAFGMAAFKSVPREMMQFSTVAGASRVQTFWRVQVPASAPALIAAVRITATWSLGIVVIAEYMAANAGLGYVMKITLPFSRLDFLIVASLWCVVLALGFDMFIVVATRRLRFLRGSWDSTVVSSTSS
jgi:ABC-type nitrate/sulfonate/bicarbonate transport system permease component